MKVLILDDQESVRSALRCALEQEQNMQVVGEIGDRRSLVKSLETTRPHLLIIDWDLLNGDTDAFLERLRERFPDLYILAMYSRYGIGRLSINNEISAIVSKSDSPTQLLTKLRAINKSIMELSDKALR
jgi:DNA-binding NarL/FixJ family response regulator